jgi:hypothetical protein
MTRFDFLKFLSIEDTAKMIVENNLTNSFCKNECEIDFDIEDCLHPIECCIRWLKEEVKKI